MRPLYHGMLPPSLVRRLADIWPDGNHLITKYGEKFPDRSVWAEAIAHGYTIITKVSDFSDAEKYPGPPPQVIRLTVGNAIPADLETYLREHAAEIEAFAASGERHRDI